MALIENVDFGHYYHIYNRGINSSKIFYEDENYHYFLGLYDKYITPVANTFAWCLLNNHFHFFIRIKELTDIDTSEIKSSKGINPSRQFSHLFNAYTQAINKRYNRTGSLFEKPFKRKLIEDEKYFNRLIYYIHNNPVHHNIVSHLSEYKWSSYNLYINRINSRLIHVELPMVFGNLENFKFFHKSNYNFDDINSLTLE
jgi:REP element-mobilizing transposase RayT